MRNQVAKSLPRSKFIPFHVPQIDEDEIRSVVETLRSGWLTTGVKQTKQFEEDLLATSVSGRRSG